MIKNPDKFFEDKLGNGEKLIDVFEQDERYVRENPFWYGINLIMVALCVLTTWLSCGSLQMENDPVFRKWTMFLLVLTFFFDSLFGYGVAVFRDPISRFWRRFKISGFEYVYGEKKKRRRHHTDRVVAETFRNASGDIATDNKRSYYSPHIATIGILIDFTFYIKLSDIYGYDGHIIFNIWASVFIALLMLGMMVLRRYKKNYVAVTNWRVIHYDARRNRYKYIMLNEPLDIMKSVYYYTIIIKSTRQFKIPINEDTDFVAPDLYRKGEDSGLLIIRGMEDDIFLCSLIKRVLNKNLRVNNASNR